MLAARVEIVLVHDAARALTPVGLFDAVVAAVRAGGHGHRPGARRSATRSSASTRDDTVVETVDRSRSAHVQTPQGFPRASARRAYAARRREHTDDAALFPAAGGAVSVVDGDARAFKITTPWDLRRAETVLRRRGARSRHARRPALGIGVDVHAFDDDRRRSGSPACTGRTSAGSPGTATATP